MLATADPNGDVYAAIQASADHAQLINGEIGEVLGRTNKGQHVERASLSPNDFVARFKE